MPSFRRTLRRLASLSRDDRGLLARTFVLVAAIRMGLWLFLFASVRRMALKTGESQKPGYPVDRLVWAVVAVSRYFPGSTCLTQALAGQALLARNGYKSRVQIGVVKDEKRQFESHAWLIFGDEVVIGGPRVDRYTSMIAWEAK